MIETKQEWEIGDCLDLMPSIETGSVDMILCDLPYGTTACSWDTIIPFELLWKEWKRISKDNAAIVLMASQPFTTDLINSNRKMFKYCWVWNKVRPVGFQVSKYKPMMQTEDVVIFGDGRVNYYPITIPCKPYTTKCYTLSKSSPLSQNDGAKRIRNSKLPSNLITFSNASNKNRVHPTQKPVELFEYLIRTYSNEGDTVHDSCLGSGTTLEACRKTNRNCIGFEISDEWEHLYPIRSLAYNPPLSEWL